MFFDHFMGYSDDLKPYLNENEKDVPDAVKLGKDRNARTRDLSDRIESGVHLEDGFYQPGDLIGIDFNIETLGGNYVIHCQEVSLTRAESMDNYDQLPLDPQVFKLSGEIAMYFSYLQFFHVGTTTFALPHNDDLWGQLIVLSINCDIRYPVMLLEEYKHVKIEKSVKVKLLPENLELQKQFEVLSREAVKIASVGFWFIAVFLMAIVKDIHV